MAPLAPIATVVSRPCVANPSIRGDAITDHDVKPSVTCTSAWSRSTPDLARMSRPMRSASCCEGRSAGRTGGGGGEMGTGRSEPGHTWAQAWPAGQGGIGQSSGARAALEALADPLATPTEVHVLTPSDEVEQPDGVVVNAHPPRPTVKVGPFVGVALGGWPSNTTASAGTPRAAAT